MAISLHDMSVGCFVQTLGAVEGFLAKGLAHCKEKGLDPNEPGPSTAGYAGLQKLVSEAKQSLETLTPDDVNALEGKDVVFSVRDLKLPFKAEGFLMTFSLPNFHFHATTAYDILRSKGVPLGKRDYMGRMKLAN